MLSWGKGGCPVTLLGLSCLRELAQGFPPQTLDSGAFLPQDFDPLFLRPLQNPSEWA